MRILVGWLVGWLENTAHTRDVKSMKKIYRKAFVWLRIRTSVGLL